MSNVEALPLLGAEASEATAPCCPPLTERPFTTALAAGESANYGFSVELPA